MAVKKSAVKRSGYGFPVNQVVVLFDPVSDGYFFGSFDAKVQQAGSPSESLRKFVAGLGLDVVAEAAGMVVVKVTEPLLIGMKYVDAAAAAGFGVGIPRSQQVLCRGDEIVERYSMSTTSVELCTVSDAVIADWIRFARVNAIAEKDTYGIVIVEDLDDPTGLTFIQTRYVRAAGRWDVEYQAGALDRHYAISFSDTGLEADLAPVIELFRSWIRDQDAIAAQAKWEHIRL